MPLVVMVGLPSSGKTTRAQQIARYLTSQHSLQVHLISDNDISHKITPDKNTLFMDSQKEKELRGILKSSALRLLTRDNVVILDAGNYIKGYRYELYCAAKNSKVSQVCVECVVEKAKCWAWNQAREPPEDRYSEAVFNSLHLRYEPPDSSNRWDSALISLLEDGALAGQELYDSLFLKKPPPPNLSTQSLPLSSSSFLYELDKITQDIVNEMVERKRSGCEEWKGINLSGVSAPLLARSRRQFINYTKLHPSAQDQQDIAALFTQFLLTSLSY